MKGSEKHIKYMQLLEEVKSKIPKDEWKKVMSQEDCEYEIGNTDGFLGFLETYNNAKQNIPPNIKTIIDLGCYLAAQSYMFVEYDRYIGIDIGMGSREIRFTPPNATHEYITIQDYIAGNDFIQEEVFAICSYVPDEEARELVEKTFDNCYIFYPGDREILKVNGEYIMRWKNDTV